MARIRTIKPEFWTDEKLSPLPPITRLVFLGLVSLADDAGRLLDNVKWLDGQLFPNTEDSARESLDTLARLSRICRYTSDSGQRLLQITGWSDHQKVDRPSKYVLPAPTPEQLAAHAVTADPRNSREDVASMSRDTRAPTLDHGPRTLDQQPPGADAPSGAASSDSGAPGLTLTPDPESAAVPPKPKARARAKRAAASEADDAFPKAVCDALYEHWTAKVGAVNYGLLRKSLRPLWVSDGYEEPDDDARLKRWCEAITVYVAWSGDDSFESRNRSVTRFAQNARDFWHAAGLPPEQYLNWRDRQAAKIRRPA